MEENHFTDVMNEASGTETPSAQLDWDGSLNEIDPTYSDQYVHVSPFQEEETDQPSQGGLIDQHQHSHLETIAETYEDLEIEVIRHFTLIPDFKTATDSKYPIVAKTPHGYFCLDGWNLIEDAKAKGKRVITCAVESLAVHINEELSLRKGALRFKPRGGVSSYAEKVRIVESLKQMLLASTNDLRIFNHGGTRRGVEFTNNKQEDVIRVLARRLGKSVSTINQYLSHGRHLSEETLNLLATREVGKDFFEKANLNKTAKITRMRSDRLSDAEVTDQISTCMLKWLQDYEQHKTIEPVWKNAETSPSEESREDNTQEPAPVQAKEEKIFNPWRGNREEPENDSFEHLKRDVRDLAKGLSEAVTLDDPNLFYDRIMEETPRFYHISLRVAALRKIQREV